MTGLKQSLDTQVTLYIHTNHKHKFNITSHLLLTLLHSFHLLETDVSVLAHYKFLIYTLPLYAISVGVIRPIYTDNVYNIIQNQ